MDFRNKLVFVRGKPFQARLEKLANDKHSSLLRKSVNYGSKTFYSTGLRLVHRHLRNIDCLTARVFFISTVNGRSKKRRKEPYYELRQQRAHKQNLSNLFWPFDIYGLVWYMKVISTYLGSYQGFDKEQCIMTSICYQLLISYYLYKLFYC